MNTTWIIVVVVIVLLIKGVLLHGFVKRKMAESAGRNDDRPPASNQAEE